MLEIHSIIIFVVLWIPSLAVHAQSPRWVVDVEPYGWNDANPEDVYKIVVSAGSTLLEYGNGLNLQPILLRNHPQGPLTLYRLPTQNQYTVLVHITDRKWSQLAYQFSHEFCHILSNYDTSRNSANQWFEEAVCEGASLYTLKRMSETWRTDPPHQNWRSYSSSLATYLRHYLQENHRYLEAGTDLSDWYAKEKRSLRHNHGQRHKNEIVGTKIFYYFLESPDRWRSIRYLNLTRAPDLSLQQYLGVWYKDLPKALKHVAIEIAGWFGYPISDH